MEKLVYNPNTTSEFLNNKNVSSLVEVVVNTNRTGYVFSVVEEYVFNLLFVVMTVFTIVANLITFIVIRRTPSLKKPVFNMFLTSLCLSDILSATISPIVSYRKITGYYNFLLPEFCCKLAISIEYWTSCVTMQHVLVVAAFRLIAIQSPLTVKKITRKHAKIVISAIWIATFIIGAMPYLVIVIKGIRKGPNGETTATCLMNKRFMYILKSFRWYAYPFIWYIPMILVIVMSIMLSILLLQRRKSGPANNNNQNQNKEIKAIVQLAVIIGSFFFGYIPDLAFRLYIISFRQVYGNIWMPYHVWFFSVISHALMRFSECWNPLLYNMSSNQIWAATKVFFEDYKCKKKRLTAQKKNVPRQVAKSVTGSRTPGPSSSRETHLTTMPETKI